MNALSYDFCVLLYAFNQSGIINLLMFVWYNIRATVSNSTKK